VIGGFFIPIGVLIRDYDPIGPPNLYPLGFKSLTAKRLTASLRGGRCEVFNNLVDGLSLIKGANMQTYKVTSTINGVVTVETLTSWIQLRSYLQSIEPSMSTEVVVEVL
jgi:hypothetical protein